jgi:tetratricopeptide (TPR) repeat protein
MNILFENLKLNRLKKRGMNYLNKGKAEKAYRCFEKVILSEDSPENFFNLGLTLMGMFEYADAQKYLQKVYDKIPENDINSLSLAECLLMMRKWDEAKDILKKLRKRNPKLAGQYLEIAKDVVLREKFVRSRELFRESTVELKNKNDLRALDLLLDAKDLNPENANILNNIGSIYMLLKDYEKAHQFFEQAVSLSGKIEKFQTNLLKAKHKLK